MPRPLEPLKEQPHAHEPVAESTWGVRSLLLHRGQGLSAMMTLAQLRVQLEQSFAPLACDCSLSGDASLTVRLFHPHSGQVDLVVSGLSLEKLRTPEALPTLVEELRYELHSSVLHRNDLA